MSATRQSESIEIEAPRDRVLEVLLDFEHYPTWSDPILEARTLETNADGRGTRVAFALDMKVRTVRYTLAYTYALPESFSWKLVEGDLRDIEGCYHLDALEDERTRATCEQAVDPGFWIPGPIRRIAESTALRSSLEELRRAVETAG